MKNAGQIYLKVLLLSSLWAINITEVHGQELECFTIKPPEKILKGVTKIAIIDFDIIGSHVERGKGELLSDYMLAGLLKENRGIKTIKGIWGDKEGQTFITGAPTNVYQIVERGQIAKVLAEQGFSLTGIVDDTQAAEVGKILGVDAIITGSGSYITVDENEDVKWKDTKGNTGTDHCTKRTTTAEARMKIISVSTGEVLGTKDFSQGYQSEKCNEERSGLTSASKLADFGFKDIAAGFVRYFAPEYEYIKYEFEKIKTKEFKKQASLAADYIKKSNIDKAYTIYKAIYEQDSYNPKAAYNLGLIYEIVGDFQKAFELYEIASDLDPEVKAYHIAFQRAKNGLELTTILAEVGISFGEHEFGADGGDVLAAKVRTKGSKSDRIEVRAEPENGSEVITKIPGDLEFTVIEKKGDWFLIKLLGDKQGYVHKSSVSE